MQNGVADEDDVETVLDDAAVMLEHIQQLRELQKKKTSNTQKASTGGTTRTE